MNEVANQSSNQLSNQRINQSTEKMIEVVGLTKRFGGETAVSDLTFSCGRGEIVGFLGPNGAGKTTTMRMLTGTLAPTAGRAAIAGQDTVRASLAARRALGYLPESVPLYPEMVVRDYLRFMGEVRQVAGLDGRITAVLDSVGLLDRANSVVRTLSKGMRQRLGLAQAILHDPPVLILDEPTIGLDPAQVVAVRALIQALGKERTVLLSSHLLAEVAQICSRALILVNGRLRADVSLGGEAGVVIVLRTVRIGEVAKLRAIAGVREVEQVGETEFRLMLDEEGARERVVETAVSEGWGVVEVKTAVADLEKLFLAQLGEGQ